MSYEFLVISYVRELELYLHFVWKFELITM